VIRSLLLAFLLLLLPPPANAQDAPLAGSAVKIISNLENDAHGSGVVLDGGLVVTAAHVLNGKWSLYVLTDRDGAQPLLAKVILFDLRSDLAVLELESAEGIATSPLDCRPAVIGEPIRTTGNPGPLAFVTSWGRVAGAVRRFDRWSSVYVVDLTVAGGNSGGPVLDADGAVIGIIVGVMQTGIGGVVPISLAVPSTVICSLLGRT
jgi:S1-C subfamily serine protease